MTWLLIFILLPGIGLIIYGVLGRNIRKRKIFKTQKLANNIKEEKLFEDLYQIEELVKVEMESIKKYKLLDDEGDISKKRVISLLLNTGKFPFTINNKVDVFENGNKKFDRLIQDIKEAKDHIHLEYFIIKDSDIGRQIKELLIKRAREGIDIRILYDDVGCWRCWFHRNFFN
ncbi:MAG: cardiolipin synthase, partial [Peptostreptococcaceae bacterium]